MTATQSITNLAGRIQSILDRTGLADPNDIASALLAEMTWDERAEAFEQEAPNAVSRYLTRHRFHSDPEPSVSPAGPRRHGVPLETQSDRMRTFLAERAVGAGGVWKLLADFTAEDCDYAMRDRHQRAQSIMRRGDWFGRVREAMCIAGAQVMRDLPPVVLADLQKSLE